MGNYVVDVEIANPLSVDVEIVGQLLVDVEVSSAIDLSVAINRPIGCEIEVTNTALAVDVLFDANYIIWKMIVDYGNNVEFMGITSGVPNTNAGADNNWKFEVQPDNTLIVYYKNPITSLWEEKGGWLPQF